jgi:hypothetical protein
MCAFRAAEALEREKLLASGSMSDITPHDLLQPHSDFHIRNRYLSRIGAPVRLMFKTNSSIRKSEFAVWYLYGF